MEKHILLILDNAHQKNNLYYKSNDDFRIHSKILDEVISKYPEQNEFYIFGEPIVKSYNIKYKNKDFIIDGEETDTNMFLFKLLNGFSGILFEQDGENKFTISSRIQQKLKYKSELEPSISENSIFKLFTNLLKNINDENRFDEYIKICDELEKLTSNQIIKNSFIALKFIINQKNQKLAYDISLSIRDTIISEYIKNLLNKNIIIIIGGNHKDNIIQKLNIEQVLEKNIEELLPTQDISQFGGNTLYKIKNISKILDV